MTVAEARRLLLGEDGFARVDSPSKTPISSITVSSWVNITQFPGGVAPMVTLISEDATYQIAFFVREDGAGVLWGGPATAALPPQDDYVDRQPRTRFRRDAVDYSMGLGDVMNIMGPRKERSNTWTPMNFVDVSEMGVADLETSGSTSQNHYEDWYDVGYELQMQESADPEPKIITKPSGKNDFIVINYDRSGPLSLSSNQWDPVDNLKVPEPIHTPQQPTKIRAPDNERFVWSQEENKEGSWTTNVKPVIRSQIRNGLPPVFSFPTTTPKIEKENKKLPTRNFVPELLRLANSEGSKSRPGIFRYANRRQRPTTTTPKPTTTTTSSTTTTTTTVRPLVQVDQEIRTSQESRVPLWARLKKTSSGEKEIKPKLEDIFTTTEEPTTPQTTEARIITKSRPTTRFRTTTRPRPTTRIRTTTRAPTTFSQVPRIRIPTSSRPTSYRGSASSQSHVTVRPPVTSTRRSTSLEKSTTKQTLKHKTQQHLNSQNTASKERKFTHLNSNKRKGQNSGRTKNLLSRSLDEFKRVLEGKPSVEDIGHKVVVYSMPITDEDGFNKMYEKYQQTEARQSPRINLHLVYERAREGHHQGYSDTEEESNQNQLEQIPEPLPVLTYKEEPLHYAEPEQLEVTLEREVSRNPVLSDPVPSRFDVPTRFVPSRFDDSSFRPVERKQPYSNFEVVETDYSEYYPHIHKAEPVLVSSLDDPMGQASEDQYSVDSPLLSVAAAALSNLQNPLLYQPAVPAEQDISGQQAGFYQEPSRISHEQLPPEYMKKTEEKTSFNTYQPSNSFNNQIRRSYNLNQYIPQNLPQPIHTAVKDEDEILHQMFEEQEPDIVESFAVPTDVEAEAIPIEDETVPEVVQDVPLNVNFRKMPYNFEANTWYHITFTWSSEDHVLRIYVNGELAGLLEGTIAERQTLPATGVMLLGKTLLPSLTGFDPTSHLNGEMSNFVVWGESLSPQEVNSAFKCQSSPNRPVLLTWSSTPLRVYNDASVRKAPPICGISS